MMKKFFNNIYVTGIISGAVAILLTSTCDVLNHIPLFTTLKGIFTTTYNIIITILFFKLTVWMLLIIVILIPIVIYIISLKKPKKVEVIIKPDYLNDKEAVIKGWLCSWNYKNNGRGYQFSDFKFRCPKDRSTLFYNQIGYACPLCNKQYGKPINDLLLSQSDEVNIMIDLTKDYIANKYNLDY